MRQRGRVLGVIWKLKNCVFLVLVGCISTTGPRICLKLGNVFYRPQFALRKICSAVGVVLGIERSGLLFDVVGIPDFWCGLTPDRGMRGVKENHNNHNS